jgi:hypothetical protein
MRRALALALALLPLAGCDDATTMPPPSTCAPELPTATSEPSFDTGPELGTTCAATVHVGVRHFGTGDRTGFLNAALRKQVPPVQHVVAATEGACRQWLTPGYNCGLGTCTSDQLCVGMNTCAAAPPSFGAGTIRVQAEDILTDVPDTGLGIYYGQLGDIAGCGNVSASAPGGDFPAFTLSTTLVPALHLMDAETLRYVRGQAMTVKWYPADASSRVRVTLRADHGAHGQLLSSIVECDLPDSAGSVTIPVAMIDRHLDEFTCGNCPSASVTRYRRVSGQAGDTPVELLIEDEADVFISP